MWPVYGPDELAAVEEVIRSGKTNYWTGKQGKALEAEYAEHLGVNHCVALANGTVALQVALQSFGITGEVIVPARTFFGTAAAVVNAGCVPVVCDIDPVTNCMTPDTIADKLSPMTEAIIPVHLGGWPCDMPAIMELAHKHGLIVIEDCAQAHGGSIDGRMLGSFGHGAAFSFCQDKLIPAGEGGLFATDDTQAYESAWSMKDHGKRFGTQAGKGFSFVHDSFGTNWRMTEVSAALARVGLAKLERRRLDRIVKAMDIKHSLLGLIDVPYVDGHALYRLYARHPKRDELLDIDGVAYGSSPAIYREAAFGSHAPLPNAEALMADSFCFLLDGDASRTAEEVRGRICG